MREIKYRQPSMVGGKFDSWYYWGWQGDSFIGPMTGRHKTESMQYTGLKDKNEKLIFEGDIQKIVLGNFYWIFIVKELGGIFGNQLFSICVEHNATTDDEGYTMDVSKGKCLIRDYVRSGKNCEVIGNIFENPELIPN